MNGTIGEILALCGIIGCGLLLGRISWRGISLGTSGVVFAALAAGHYGFQVPEIAGVVGVILFVYCLGIAAGPTFLRTFARQGKMLALLAVAMIVSATLAAWIVAKVFGLGPDLASGLFAGAMTSTPALAAASERLPADSQVAVGFGVAYPFGVIGVIVFVQLMQKLFRDDATIAVVDHGEDDGPIMRVLLRVQNPMLAGKALRDVSLLAYANCQVSRLLDQNELRPIPPDYRLHVGDCVLVVGAERRLRDVIEVLGERCDDLHYVLDVEHHRRRVVVTAKEMLGKSLEELHLRSRFGVTVSRIARHNVEFVPGPQERIQFGDALTAIGEPEGLDLFVKFAGHRERTLDETDLVALCAGMILGIVLGRVQLSLGGQSLSLGMAGGPLLAGLMLGHFGRIGPLQVRVPRAARFLLSDIGLSLFLAQAGAQAGGQFVDVIREHGPFLCLAAIVVVAVPLGTGMLLARYVMRLPLLDSMGGICGAMTSTPGLGVVTSTVESPRPAVSYATVYPLALIVVTLMAPILIALLS